MAANRDTFTCTSCGYVTGKWIGFCPQCRASDSLVVSAEGGALQTVRLADAGTGGTEHGRVATGVSELDRVLGGGAVPGSVTLLGGDPGIGKSTLMLQAAARLSRERPVAYVSGEESVAQVAGRAMRVTGANGGLMIAAERDADVVAAAVGDGRYDMVVVDSIQTMTCRDVDSTTGGVAQLREAAARIIAAAKKSATAVVLVGHVTKDGSIAGPRQVEHMVDVVLHLEGESVSGFRHLRPIKNRFGSVDVVGIFAMTEAGLRGVADPTSAFVTGRRDVPGSVLFPAIHGRRALVVEVQALVAPAAPHGSPRRSMRGVENARVHQLLAVLERHVGYRFHDREVFVSIVGGLRIVDPAVDLAVALALASSHAGVALPPLAAFGEVGLTGEVRTAQRVEARRNEVSRLDGVTMLDAGRVATIAEALGAVGLRPERSVIQMRKSGAGSG